MDAKEVETCPSCGEYRESIGVRTYTQHRREIRQCSDCDIEWESVHPYRNKGESFRVTLE
jgi:hypothetical protein